MKIDGKEYNFKVGKCEIKKEELALTNKNMVILFDYFSGNDGILSVDDLKKAYGMFAKMDNENNVSDGVLTNKEIEKGFENLDEKFKKITTYDIKAFVSEVSVVMESKKLASDLKTKLNGATWSNASTKNLLGKINEENAADVLTEYDKLETEDAEKDKDYTKETLQEAVLDEITLPLIGTDLGITAVKDYICKPLVKQAKNLGISSSIIGNYANINDEVELNNYINKLKKTVMTHKRLETADVHVLNNVHEPFEPATRKKMYHIKHKTKLLDEAQKYIGIQEVTAKEYKKLAEEEKKFTQKRIIGKNGNGSDLGTGVKGIGEAWCAHTQCFLAKEVGMDIGSYKSSVYKNKKNSFVSWAQDTNTWHPLKMNKMTKSNVIQERGNRAKEIRQQMSNGMKEGDYIIWGSYDLEQKGNYVSVEGEGFVKSTPSHIGLIESVDKAMGTVTVIEGNSNIMKHGNNGNDRQRVTTEEGAIIGNETIGSYQEVNRRDGLIRKVYTVEELVKSGYAGYIDNQARVNAAQNKPAPTPKPDEKTTTPENTTLTSNAGGVKPNPTPAAKAKEEPVRTFKLLGVDVNVVKTKSALGAEVMKLDDKSVQALKQKIKLPDSKCKFQAPIDNTKNVYVEQFGYFMQNRPLGNKKRPHMGLDIFVSEYAKKPAQPVVIKSPIEGVVISVQKSDPKDTRIGNTVIILGRDGRQYSFKHMANQGDYSTSIPMPKPGQYMQIGDPIGQVGATGGTEMWHLHFEVMTDEAKAKQLKDSKWQKVAAESSYSEIRGVVNPLDESQAGPIAKQISQYKNRDKKIIGNYQFD